MRRVALACVGLILIGAAFAKVAALGGRVDSLGWPLPMIVLGAATELLLGFWLLSGVAVRSAHLVTIGLFLLFAVLSTYQVVRGVPSCGCLGKLYVHPAWMLTFDLFVLMALGVLWFVERRRTARDARSEGVQESDRSALPPRRYALIAGAVGCVVLFGASFAGWAFAGSLEGALRISKGETLVISPAAIDVGRAAVGETRTARIRIVNPTGSPVRIVGGKNSCGCMVTRNLPITVPPRGSAEAAIDVTIRAAGPREVIFTLFTDHDERRQLAGRVRMHGEPAAEPAATQPPTSDPPLGPGSPEAT